MSLPVVDYYELAKQRERQGQEPPAAADRGASRAPAPGAAPRSATVQQPIAGRIACPHCHAHYRPDLVKNACPVCRTPSPGVHPARRASLRDDDRLILIVALATLANLVVLGILAIAVLS